MKIKTDKLVEYQEYIERNHDAYGATCVAAGERYMNLLDQGKSFDEAEAGFEGLGLTGFMAGAAIAGVVYFHERGEEVKKWWNKKWGREDAEGTINPAIIEI